MTNGFVEAYMQVGDTGCMLTARWILLALIVPQCVLTAIHIVFKLLLVKFLKNIRNCSLISILQLGIYHMFDFS